MVLISDLNHVCICGWMIHNFIGCTHTSFQGDVFKAHVSTRIPSMLITPHFWGSHICLQELHVADTWWCAASWLASQPTAIYTCAQYLPVCCILPAPTWNIIQYGWWWNCFNDFCATSHIFWQFHTYPMGHFVLSDFSDLALATSCGFIDL